MSGPTAGSSHHSPNVREGLEAWRGEECDC